jgi:hypothetical protein
MGEVGVTDMERCPGEGCVLLVELLGLPAAGVQVARDLVDDLSADHVVLEAWLSEGRVEFSSGPVSVVLGGSSGGGGAS